MFKHGPFSGFLAAWRNAPPVSLCSLFHNANYSRKNGQLGNLIFPENVAGNPLVLLKALCQSIQRNVSIFRHCRGLMVRVAKDVPIEARLCKAVNHRFFRGSSRAFNSERISPFITVSFVFQHICDSVGNGLRDIQRRVRQGLKPRLSVWHHEMDTAQRGIVLIFKV